MNPHLLDKGNPNVLPSKFSEDGQDDSNGQPIAGSGNPISPSSSSASSQGDPSGQPTTGSRDPSTSSTKEDGLGTSGKPPSIGGGPKNTNDPLISADTQIWNSQTIQITRQIVEI